MSGSEKAGGARKVLAFLKAGERTTGDALEARSKFWELVNQLSGSTPLRTGFPRIDGYIKPRPQRYFVIAARPGMFKTTWAWNAAANLALSGKKVLWLGVEMPDAMMHGWLVSRLSGLPLDRILDGSLTPEVQTSLSAHSDSAASLPLVTWPHSVITLDELTACVLRVPYTYDAIFLDYLQLVQAPGRDVERISAVSQVLQRIAYEGNTTVFALAQMNREIERADRTRLPQLSDLKGAGQIEQDADAVCFLHRMHPELKRRVDFRIVKNRWGEPDVFVPLRADPEVKFIEEWCDTCNGPLLKCNGHRREDP